MHYFSNKGLFIKRIGDNRYTIQDVFGTCLLPFQATEKELDLVTEKIANVRKLVTIEVDSEFPNLSDFKWNEFEYFYTAHLGYAFLASLLEKNERNDYQLKSYMIPIGYLELGYGEGKKDDLCCLDKVFKNLCKEENTPIQERDLTIFLTKNQVGRICSDIQSLMMRSIYNFTDILKNHRGCIIESYQALEQLDTEEIVHRGSSSYRTSSAVTSLVISLCSSLDLSAKLIQYINTTTDLDLVYKVARDKQYHEIKRIKAKVLNDEILEKIIQLQESNKEIPEMTQFRNDLIHSTSALELEKIYVGLKTKEINNLPLYYSAQYARDCTDTGQPVRFLGRDYFVEKEVDIEVKTLSWINSVFEYHIKVGEYIYNHLKSIEKM